jgi:imidazolonepropionase-like amidohydrolase
MKSCAAVLVVAFGVAAASFLGAQRLPLLPDGETLGLVDANVVDVRRGTVIRGRTVIVRNGRIESIGETAPPQGVRVLNVSGNYLIPD